METALSRSLIAKAEKGSSARLRWKRPHEFPLGLFRFSAAHGGCIFLVTSTLTRIRLGAVALLLALPASLAGVLRKSPQRGTTSLQRNIFRGTRCSHTISSVVRSAPFQGSLRRPGFGGFFAIHSLSLLTFTLNTPAINRGFSLARSGACRRVRSRLRRRRRAPFARFEAVILPQAARYAFRALWERSDLDGQAAPLTQRRYGLRFARQLRNAFQERMIFQADIAAPLIYESSTVAIIRRVLNVIDARLNIHR